ncbi:MAG TPA: acyl-CoA thioesterase [Gemmatimonadales bacterium]|jgi:acyl-CoA hydrolase|nr:acyl-CoA thioesterase [Gemmatimonadales bacterium]
MERPRKVTLRFLAAPTDVNFGGKVHGGAVMKWIDQAGYTCAAGWTGRYCVTVYVGGIHFVQPIHVGDVVEVRALVIYTGRSSLHVAVDVYARNPRETDGRRTGHCVIVFVPLGEHGRPEPVPKWTPVTEVDRALEAYALELADLRREMDAKLEQQLERLNVRLEASG